MGKSRPYCKLAAMFVQYRGLTVLQQTRPNPDVSRSIDVPLLTALAQEKTKLDECEEFLRNNRELFQSYLVEKLDQHNAASLFNDLEEAVMRLLCGKSLVVEFEHGVSGKWPLAKARLTQAGWARYLSTNYLPLVDIIDKFGVGTLEEGASAGGEVRKGLSYQANINKT